MQKWRIGSIWVGSVVVICALAAPVWANDEGGATPREAAERALRAWESGDLAALHRAILPALRNDRTRGVTAFTAAIRVSKFVLGDAVIDENGNTARLPYEWECKFDVDAYKLVAAHEMREWLRASGMPVEELDERLDAAIDNMSGYLSVLARHVERRNHVMTLHRIDGRWYVATPMESPTAHSDESSDVPKPNVGAQSPEDAARELLAALHVGDVDRFAECAADDGLGFDFVDAMRFLNGAFDEFAVTAVRRVKHRAVVEFTWNADLDVETAIERAVAALATEMKIGGADADAIERNAERYRRRLNEAADTIAADFGRATAMQVRERDGRWVVESLMGASPDYLELGAETPRDAAFKALAALRERDFAEAEWFHQTAFDTDMMRHLVCLTVQAFVIEEVVILDDDTARVRFEWSVTFDVDAFIAADLARQRQALQAQGVDDEDELRVRLEAFAASIASAIEDLRAMIESDDQTMRLVRQNDRWFVAVLIGG